MCVHLRLCECACDYSLCALEIRKLEVHELEVVSWKSAY